MLHAQPFSGIGQEVYFMDKMADKKYVFSRERKKICFRQRADPLINGHPILRGASITAGHE